MNDQMPVGYKAADSYGGWWNTNKEKYAWLIFLIIAVIFVILSIAFESLKLPFAVIYMIPISFIGLFLVFGLSKLPFDQGGFAALVMLCGIVVNAGIYLVMAYKHILSVRTSGLEDVGNRAQIRAYLKAFSLKSSPIMLTVLSTVLGLVPFLTDGPGEVFWFDFAVGTIGGMILSLLAIIFILPVFVVRNAELDTRK